MMQMHPTLTLLAHGGGDAYRACSLQRTPVPLCLYHLRVDSQGPPEDFLGGERTPPDTVTLPLMGVAAFVSHASASL